MNGIYPRGSEWRKWDLHVHTPLSIEQHYGGDQDEVWENYLKDARRENGGDSTPQMKKTGSISPFWSLRLCYNT